MNWNILQHYTYIELINVQHPTNTHYYGDEYVIPVDNYAHLKITIIDSALVSEDTIEIALVENGTNRTLKSVLNYAFLMYTTPLLEMYHFLKFSMKMPRIKGE